MLKGFLLFISNALFAGGYVVDFVIPHILVLNVIRTRRLRPEAPPLKGVSVDYVIFTIQSTLYRLLFVLCYVFPTATVVRQNAARYPLTPSIDKARIAADLPYTLSTLFSVGLIVVPDFAGARAQLRLRFSTIAKWLTGCTLALVILVYILSCRVHVDPITGQGYWGLFQIDLIDLLKGVSDLLEIARYWPQVVVNWEEANTVAWSKPLTYSLLVSAGMYLLSYMFRALATGSFVLAVRQPGGFLHALYMVVVCSVFFLQHYLYKDATNRLLRGLDKRSTEFDDFEIDDGIEERIQLTPV
ncbi:hypothetical protein V1512DRAFT_259061 [Lipomyces arxii]|uniref:uncharacterized protein n=1 Tax=Lipomyces arxii TaxID=56418 RepID=UPI0034CD7C8B